MVSRFNHDENGASESYKVLELELVRSVSRRAGNRRGSVAGMSVSQTTYIEETGYESSQGIIIIWTQSLRYNLYRHKQLVNFPLGENKYDMLLSSSYCKIAWFEFIELGAYFGP